MSVKERLIEFAKTKEKSVRSFEMKTGLTIGYINAIRVSIQPDKIQRIASCYPDLNTEWLLTGLGQMLKPANNPSSAPILDNAREERLLSIIESQQRTIERLSEYLNLKH